jgi:hypothetical protein
MPQALCDTMLRAAMLLAVYSCEVALCAIRWILGLRPRMTGGVDDQA